MFFFSSARIRDPDPYPDPDSSQSGSTTLQKSHLRFTFYIIYIFQLVCGIGLLRVRLCHFRRRQVNRYRYRINC
jgi:hypothetical protein